MMGKILILISSLLISFNIYSKEIIVDGVSFETVIDNFDGLKGTYKNISRNIPAEELKQISFFPTTTDGESSWWDGMFQMVLNSDCEESGCDIVEGIYHATPNNPCIGYAFISFQVSRVELVSAVVRGIKRDRAGNVSALLMQGVAANALPMDSFIFKKTQKKVTLNHKF